MTERRPPACRRPVPGRQRALPMHAWLLALALAWATAWGAWHRTAHAWPETHRQAALADHPHAAGPGLAAAAAAELGAPGWQPWHHPVGGDDCRLIDHLMWADALTAPALLPALPPAVAVQVAHPEAAGLPAQACPGYQARAPPQA